jgi:plasmid stabilization system protein ParE
MAAFVLAAAAEDDLLEIGGYIAQQQGTDLADRVLRELEAAMTQLAGRPELGHRRQDLTVDPSYRFWRVHSYLIVYNANTRPLAIARVIRGSRDVRHLVG